MIVVFFSNGIVCNRSGRPAGEAADLRSKTIKLYNKGKRAIRVTWGRPGARLWEPVLFLASH